MSFHAPPGVGRRVLTWRTQRRTLDSALRQSRAQQSPAPQVHIVDHHLRRAPMSPQFNELLTRQVGNEFAASQQYIAIAAWFDGQDLPQLAKHFYRQSLEERNHAMMMVRYILDRGTRSPSRESTRSGTTSPRRRNLWSLPSPRRSRSRPQRNCSPRPAPKTIRSVNSSCSGSSRNRSRRWHPCPHS